MEVGRQFKSYDELQAALSKYSDDQNVMFYKRDSRTIAAASKKFHVRDLSICHGGLKYYEVKFACVHGGKLFKSTSAGIRTKRTSRKGCNAHISLKVTDDGQALQVVSANYDHNHVKVSKLRPFHPPAALLTDLMAKSKYEYVKQYECEDRCLLPNCWLIVRLDGKAFHRFANEHEFAKPNDERSLGLMNKAAAAVLRDFGEVCLAYGQSDEFSFVFRRDTQLYSRRAMKIVSNVCSTFTSNYVFYWSEYFPTVKLRYPPSFDGRVVLYPTDQNLRDYLSWRQADCHINNLYNTVFWALVQKSELCASDAELRLQGTSSGDKNEILFSRFHINYNDEPQLYRKGTVLIRSVKPTADGDDQTTKKNKRSVPEVKGEIMALNVDIIKDEFWTSHPEIIGNP